MTKHEISTDLTSCTDMNFSSTEWRADSNGSSSLDANGSCTISHGRSWEAYWGNVVQMHWRSMETSVMCGKCCSRCRKREGVRSTSNCVRHAAPCSGGTYGLFDRRRPCIAWTPHRVRAGQHSGRPRSIGAARAGAGALAACRELRTCPASAELRTAASETLVRFQIPDIVSTTTAAASTSTLSGPPGGDSGPSAAPDARLWPVLSTSVKSSATERIRDEGMIKI